MIKKAILAGTASLAALTMATPAAALTFIMEYSGAEYNNNATATGFITFDETQVPAIQADFNFEPIGNVVTALELTISGASSGNGVFTLADFSDITFWSDTPLDLTQELVGQADSLGTFGDFLTPSLRSDFNLFGATADAPNGTFFFQLTTNGGLGDAMGLVSLRPAVAAVPEPATWAFMILGFGAIGGMMRRQRKMNVKVSYA